MLLTPHVFLGLYFVTYFNPYIGLSLAFLSHYLFDFFYPHWNPHIYTELNTLGKLTKKTMLIILIDVMVAFLATIYISYTVLPDIKAVILIFLGAFLSILPDIFEIPYYFLKNKNGLLKKVITFEHHHQAKADGFWGVLSQLLVISLCLWQLYNKG